MAAFSNGTDGSITFTASTPTFLFKDIGVSPTWPTATGGGLTSRVESITPATAGGGGGAGGEVPEPISFILMGSGLVVLGLLKKARRI